MTTSDRALAIDALPIAIVSAAICLAADRPAVMITVVAASLGLRFALWAKLEERAPLAVELPFFAACLLLGAINDHRTVHVHGVYEYLVPSSLPSVSSVPIWMLVYWGLVLRFVASLASSRRLPGDARPTDRIRLPGVTRSAPLRVAVILALVVVTRQATYGHATDPIWSWLPYAIALGLAAVVLVPRRRDVALMAVALAVGPLVEVVYIQVGGLHRYPLGWLFGVPLWIVLWWVLAAWLFADLSGRLHRWLERAAGGRLARA